jgi:hypothetical protein
MLERWGNGRCDCGNEKGCDEDEGEPKLPCFVLRESCEFHEVGKFGKAQLWVNSAVKWGGIKVW